MRAISCAILLLFLLEEKQLLAIKIPQVWIDLITTALKNHESSGNFTFMYHVMIL